MTDQTDPLAVAVLQGLAAPLCPECGDELHPVPHEDLSWVPLRHRWVRTYACHMYISSSVNPWERKLLKHTVSLDIRNYRIVKQNLQWNGWIYVDTGEAVPNRWGA